MIILCIIKFNVSHSVSFQSQRGIPFKMPPYSLFNHVLIKSSQHFQQKYDVKSQDALCSSFTMEKQAVSLLTQQPFMWHNIKFKGTIQDNSANCIWKKLSDFLTLLKNTPAFLLFQSHPVSVISGFIS